MKLQVIIGSIREGRVSDRAAKWVASIAQNLPDTTVELVDMLEYPMPLFNEAKSPRYDPERKPVPEVKKWLDKVAEADAYAIVTPEYNRSMSPVLKNAIDYLDYQFEKKPVLLVGHGSTGGAQAIANFRMALPGVGAVTVPQAVFMTDRPGEVIDDEGNLSTELQSKPYGPQANLQQALETLKWYSGALAVARAKS
jgi:NAD(P)H-dependent FMN reductase